MKNVRIVTGRDFGWGDRSRYATPADFPLHDGSPYAAKVCYLSIVQAPFPVAPRQTLTTRFATFASLHDRCSSWNDGRSVAVKKSFWIQTHGTATAGQHLRASCRRKSAGCDRDAVQQGHRYHHMAALAQLPNGTLFAAWQAAWDTEGENDQHIRITASKEPGGRQWLRSWALPVSKIGAQWSPVPHVTAQGQLLLFYAESTGECIRDTKPKARWPPGGSIKVGCSLPYSLALFSSLLLLDHCPHPRVRHLVAEGERRERGEASPSFLDDCSRKGGSRVRR
jgi:hypothetical protein